MDEKADKPCFFICYLARLSLVYMAVSVMNACFLTFFLLRFARGREVASVSGIMDFATCLDTGISSMVFGVLIGGYGYSAMFATWAVLCGIGLLFRQKNYGQSQWTARLYTGF